MLTTITPYTPADLEALRAVVSHASLVDEFDLLQGAGSLERKLDDPFLDPAATRVVHADGHPAGFSVVFHFRGREGSSWDMIRFGVVDTYRRRGLGASLLADALAGIRERHPESGEALLSAWLPNDGGERFAARHGFRRVRSFWLMERPLGPSATATWPEGITVRTYDGSAEALAHWNDIYNESFANHWHSVHSTVEETRQFTTDPTFRADGLFLAYRSGRCVGFTRNILREHDGEVALIGTAPEARGIGLGRALLRQAVAWLQSNAAPRVILRVDGENDGALSLYRSEGFVTKRTRGIWSLQLR